MLLEDRCPAYITPDRFRANQERLEANRAPPRRLEQCVRGPPCWGEFSAAAAVGDA